MNDIPKTKKFAVTLGVALASVLVYTALVPALAKKPVSLNEKQAVARSQAQALLIKAHNTWERDKDYAKAERLLQEVLALHPHDLSAQLDYSDMLAAQGKTKEAFLMFREGLRPTNVTRVGYYDPSFLARYVELAAKVGDEEELSWAREEIVLTASTGYPNYPQFGESDLSKIDVDAMADLAIGLSQDALGHDKQALATFESVAKRHPDNALAYLYIAQQHEKMVGPGYLSARVAYAKVVKTKDPLWTKRYPNGFCVKAEAQRQLDWLGQFGYMDGNKFIPAKTK